ncbi:DUF1127 domain-containing protein [Vibrio sp.]|uniref:DUF1127 domain-containing protein n=1 Tax=Vibrio viridaestus TaxID=2487322 RepID=A0A3N9TJ67_9VIBR|nr:DUF1127 domain-containing protein [Vibrio viridaestus]MDC0610278.1 DUF1127 domain-containing protein [Vibrio sp.]RQW64388.1 DUF1127 domain-containing protein [Vibrio viridaestus]
MKHSLYITLATWLIRADIRHEERRWKRKINRTARDIPWDNPHLLRDIGLSPDGSRVNEERMDSTAKATSKVMKIRQWLSTRIPT